MERPVKPKLITCSLIDQIKDKKTLEKSRQSRTHALRATEPMFAPENQRPPPLMQMVLEETKPQNNARLLHKRFTAQKRQKALLEAKPKHRGAPCAENAKPDKPALHLPPIQDSLKDPSPRILIQAEDRMVESSSQCLAASPLTPATTTHHFLDKNFVRMLKEKQIRAQVDAENAERIALKLKYKKSHDLENMINEKKMQFKCDEGEKWQEQVELQKKLRPTLWLHFGPSKTKSGTTGKRQESSRRTKRTDSATWTTGQDPDSAQHFVYKQLADIKIKKAASRALLEEKQYVEAVTAQRIAEEAKQKREEQRRLEAVREFRDFIYKFHHEKDVVQKANRQLEKDEMSHKMQVFDQKDDIQKGLLREYHRGAREIQNEYAKVINEEFEYKQAKKRILCHAPIDRDPRPQREVEWPYLTLQDNYTETITGVPLYHKRKPQTCSGMFLPQKLCLTTEGYTFTKMHAWES